MKNEIKLINDVNELKVALVTMLRMHNLRFSRAFRLGIEGSSERAIYETLDTVLINQCADKMITIEDLVRRFT